MKKIYNFSQEDLARADWCEPASGELFAGGYAMIYGNNYAGANPDQSLEGTVVFLSSVDNEGFWDCYDKNGDLLIIMDENLMPLSDKEKDLSSQQIRMFQYEAKK